MEKRRTKLATLSLTEAQKRLGVSRGTLWRIIRKYQIPTFKDVLDERVKRVRAKDIEKIYNEAQRVREGVTDAEINS